MNENAYGQNFADCYVPQSNAMADDSETDVQDLLKFCQSEFPLSTEGNAKLVKSNSKESEYATIVLCF